jgi:AAA family ATP:ADP antiporter
MRNPGGEVTAWGFYVFGDLFSTVMVAVFFAFLNDTVSPHSAKRLYGPIVLGGIAGGAFGASIVNLGTGSGSLPAWMLVCAAIQVILVLHARGAAAHAAAVAEEPVPTEAAHPERIKLHSAALVGARTVLKSPYVLSIMLIVGLYESVSALMDFQFSSTIEHFSSAGDIQGRFARVFAGANWLSFVIQIFLTSFILTRHGVTTALLTLPTAIFAGSLGFLVFPKVLTASLLSAIDNGFSYSINQSAKETLYIPTDHAVKYSAKAFIDMFIQRFAKVVAILFTLGVSAYFGGFETVRWMSLVVLGVVVVWIWRARHAGEEFSRLVESVDGAGVPRSTTPQ